jgi:hypothetical protein
MYRSTFSWPWHRAEWLATHPRWIGQEGKTAADLKFKGHFLHSDPFKMEKY